MQFCLSRFSIYNNNSDLMQSEEEWEVLLKIVSKILK